MVPLALALAGAASAGCSSPPETGRDPEVTSRATRSPVLATILAVFPGFFVHGLGTIYAGNTSRGSELLQEEGLGVIGLGVGAGLGALGYYENGQADKSRDAVRVYHRFGEVTSFLGAGLAGTFGLVWFFDSWIRDIMEASGHADEHNRRLHRENDPPPLPADTTVPGPGQPTSPPLGPSVADVTTAGSAHEAPRRPGRP